MSKEKNPIILPAADKPRSERLPRGYFGLLSAQMIELGRIAMPGILEFAPVPSTVTKSLAQNNTILDLEYVLGKDRVTGQRKVTEAKARLAEQESYLPNPYHELYIYQDLALNLSRRMKTYHNGAYLMLPDETIITLDLDTPITSIQPPGWRSVVRNAGQEFGRTQFEDLTCRLREFAEQLTQNL